MNRVMKCVLPGGYLDGNRLLRRETLYIGTNGREVERFYLTPTESYIFKPLTNSSQYGKERLIYEQVLPSLQVPTPKIIATSQSECPEQSWIIFEDLGSLSHRFEEKTVLQMSEYIAKWHTYPVEKVKAYPLMGPKPIISEMAASLLTKKDDLLKTESSFASYKDAIKKVYNHLNDLFNQELVFSHGDLHLGNYSLRGERVVVLDWEHAHLNLRYWDLYHLLDLSHPLFPKNVTPGLREKALDTYLSAVEQTGKSLEPKTFKKNYFTFSSVFSLWMLLLIEKDLRNPPEKWPKEALLTQWEETLTGFIKCAQHLK